MAQAGEDRHRCYHCCPHEVQGPFGEPGSGEAPELESVETTFAEGGGEVFLASGYSAREIAEKHARESGGRVYINNISRTIKRQGFGVPVAYAVSNTPVYTLRGPDRWHDKVYRAYWPTL